MNMIRGSADLQCDHFVMARDSANVCPQSFLNFARDEGCTILRAEDHMEIQRCIRVCHKMFSRKAQASLRDAGCLSRTVQAINDLPKIIRRYAATAAYLG